MVAQFAELPFSYLRPRFTLTSLSLFVNGLPVLQAGMNTLLVSVSTVPFGKVNVNMYPPAVPALMKMKVTG